MVERHPVQKFKVKTVEPTKIAPNCRITPIARMVNLVTFFMEALS